MWRGVRLLGIVQEFVRAEVIALHRAPGHFQAWRPLVAGADPIRPAIVRGKVATRPTQVGHVQFPGGIENIAPEAVLVGKRGMLFKDAAIDAAAKMLNEISEDEGIDVANDSFGVDFHAGAQRSLLGTQDERGSAQPRDQTSP